MSRILVNNRGYSLVELLVATTITAIIISAIYGPLTGALRIFRDVKSVSDNVLSKSPTISLMEGYFDRWGRGVASKEDWSVCKDCPESRHSLEIKTSANGCSEVTFFGNVHGLGFVLDNNGLGAGQHNMVNCRLATGKKIHHYLWRDGNFVDVIADEDSSFAISQNGPECIDENFTAPNAIVTRPSVSELRAGDIIQRAPVQVEFFCDTTTFDGSQLWLKVRESNLDADGNLPASTTPATPITPVNSFTATCNQQVNGECMAVEVTLELVSQTTKHDGSTRDTFTVTRIFGR